LVVFPCRFPDFDELPGFTQILIARRVPQGSQVFLYFLFEKFSQEEEVGKACAKAKFFFVSLFRRVSRICAAPDDLSHDPHQRLIHRPAVIAQRAQMRVTSAFRRLHGSIVRELHTHSKRGWLRKTETRS
jgi:hypothetical protein